MNAAEYEQRFGHALAQDDLERINCLHVGELGHWQCGICPMHDRPRHMCGCLAKKVALPIYLVSVKERGRPTYRVPCAGFDDLLAVYRSLCLRHEGDGTELRCSCPDEVDLDKADGLTREERAAIEDAEEGLFPRGF